MSDDHATPAFTDRLGRTWQLPAELDLFERVKAAADVDLLDIATTQKSLDQLRDPYTLAAALEAAAEPQALARGITRDQFRSGLDGDTLRRGADGLVDAAVFFSPDASRKVLGTIVRTARETEERIQTATLERLGEIESHTRQVLETLATSSASAGSSPESSASTPANGACGPSTGRRGQSSRKAGNAPPPSSPPPTTFTATPKNTRNRSGQTSSTPTAPSPSPAS